jgi:protease-4
VAARKPFVVSMGNVAGSGGYYVSCAAESIFADAMTITASIGVLGGKFVTTGGWNKLGISWHGVERGENAGMMSSAEPFSDKERAKHRHYMETVYSTFKKHVVEGRKGKLTQPIDELAGGRVFTGIQALERGLVDQIGGLDDAIKYAANRAGLSNFEIRVIPEPPSIFQLFMPRERGDDMARFGAGVRGSAAVVSEVQRLLARLGTANVPAGIDGFTSGLAALDPQRVAAALQMLKSLTILQNEGVVALMPIQVLSQ